MNQGEPQEGLYAAPQSTVLPESQHLLWLSPAVPVIFSLALCSAFLVPQCHDPPLPKYPLDVGLTFFCSPGPGLWASTLLFPLRTTPITSHLLEPPKQPHVSALGPQVSFRVATSTCYPSSASFITTCLPQEHEALCPSQGVGMCFARCCVCPQGLVPKGLSRPVNQVREDKSPL